MPDANELLDEINRNTHQTLKYSRRRFLGTWLAVALMSILIALALWLSVNTAHRQNQTAHLTASSAKETAKGAQESTDQIVLYLQGKQGLPGVPGANGKNGAPGQPGSVPSELPPGPKGDTGARGAAGPAGSAGPAGAAGTPGADGTTGPAGPSGAAGETGSAGEKGPTGEAGAKGEKGEKGATGATGAQGPPGAPGPQGPAGLTKVQTVIATSANNDAPVKQVTATCPTGTLPLGGGFQWVPTTEQIAAVASFPQGNGWFIEVHTVGLTTTLTWETTAYVVCGS